MSTSRDSCCLPSVKKQKHDFQVFAFVQCIIKQLLDSVFVISRVIKVSVRVISLSLRLRLITLTSTLIILDITKTLSNNCLLLDEVEHDIMNYQNRGLFYLPKPNAVADNTDTRGINNHSPKWRWLAVDIYRAAKRRGKYPPLATDTEVNICFSLY